MTDEAWIQRSLARLEALEQQRAQLEAQGQTAALAPIEAEIRSLYTALEAVAEDSNDGEPPAAQHASVDPSSNAPAPMGPHDPFAVSPLEGAGSSPFASAPVASAPVASAPVAAAPAPSMPALEDDSSFDGMDSDLLDDDFVPRSKTPTVLAAVGVVALAVGGWYMMRSQEPPAEASAPSEVKVITASEVGADTQEPKAAKGGTAERTNGLDIRETSASRRRPRGHEPRQNDGGEVEYEEDVEVPSMKRKNRVEVSGEAKDPLAGLK